MAERMEDPNHSAILTELNDRIAARGLGAMTTAVVVTYFLAERRVYFCYAGHPPMLLCQGGGPWRELRLPVSDRQANMPLGVESGSSYDIGDVTLTKGDCLFLFSDGVVEARNKEDEMFGVERLREALTAAGSTDPMTLKTHVLSELRRWSAGILDHDDVTMIALELS
jgi:sigma-B regulation protein RsbU (phosphoserine phosphatase)